MNWKECRCKKLILILFLLINGLYINAQHQELAEKPSIWQGKSDSFSDSTSILNAFKKGHFNGHFRYFFMATDNEKMLSDYYANAVGGGLRFETAPYYGLQFAVSGFYIFNVGSSDLSKPDSITNSLNRYEIGLFDISNPKNTKDIDRLEEFYLKYTKGKSMLIFGKQLINTPFINLQDGRMRPTGVEGLYIDVNELKHTTLEGGLLYAISPRSTTKWYYIGESLGIYSQGVNVDGSKSNYNGHIRSDYVAFIGLKHQIGNHFKLQAWNQYTHRIFNSSMIQLDASVSITNNQTLKASIQSIQQVATNDGGNANQSMTYTNKGAKAFTFGGRLVYQQKHATWSLNYNRITAHGRYLMPREWGRDPFFTFMARERNEGLGDVHAFMTNYQFTVPTTTLNITLAGGYYKLPDVKQTALNKYGLPSYVQLNGDMRYKFNGFLKGLEAQLLVISKLNMGNTYNSKRYIINKSNLMNYNLVVNYYF